MPPLTIAQGAVNAKLVDASREDKLIVQNLLSYTIDGAEHMNLGAWDGTCSMFDFNKSTFPAGFVLKIYREFVKAGRKVNIIRKPLPAPLGPLNPIVDAFPEDPRYDYQRQVVDLVCKYGQIIAQVATGGGKSRIAKLVHARIGRPTLFLTTRGILMHQMRDAFMRDLKVPVGIYGDDNWSETPELMNVGMVQTFAARLEEKTVEGEFYALSVRRIKAEEKATEEIQRRGKKLKWPTEDIDAAVQRNLEGMRAGYGTDAETKAMLATKVTNHMLARQATIELLQKFELLILEEAHEASGDSYYRVTRACTNAHYRLALTGTPFMKDSALANLQLEASSGPVAIRVSERMLIERGILAKPYFKYATTTKVDGLVIDNDGNEVTAKLYRSTPYDRAYALGISGSIERNNIIVREVVRAVQYGLPCMVLVNHKVHGKRLRNLLIQAGVKCNFIEGEHDQNERQAALSALKTGKIQCLIGSTILDVGVDVPAVGLVVLAGGGKAEVAVRQRIGRGLRAKASGPNVCFILDFTDPVNNHLRNHAYERRRIIDSTPGFAEGVVNEFPYKELGFVQKVA